MLFMESFHIYSATGLPTLGKPKIILASFSSSVKIDITITIHLIGLF